MPTYDYVCRTCGAEFELYQSIKADPLRECTCGKAGVVERKIGSGAGILFKGSGFYETDYKRAAPAKPAESGGTPAPAAKPADTPAAKPADSKPATPSGGSTQKAGA